MPTYDYRCSHCGKMLEVFQKITDVPLTECPECGHATLSRGPGGGIGLQFQGSGFYITDYGPRCQNKTEKDSKGKCCPCSH